MGIKEIVLEYKSLETMLHDYAVQLIAYLQVVRPSPNHVPLSTGSG